MKEQDKTKIEWYFDTMRESYFEIGEFLKSLFLSLENLTVVRSCLEKRDEKNIIKKNWEL